VHRTFLVFSLDLCNSLYTLGPGLIRVVSLMVLYSMTALAAVAVPRQGPATVSRYRHWRLEVDVSIDLHASTGFLLSGQDTCCR
jgi:hypothetical protein